jgi:hypothetical protein
MKQSSVIAIRLGVLPLNFWSAFSTVRRIIAAGQRRVPLFRRDTLELVSASTASASKNCRRSSVTGRRASIPWCRPL